MQGEGPKSLDGGRHLGRVNSCSVISFRPFPSWPSVVYSCDRSSRAGRDSSARNPEGAQPPRSRSVPDKPWRGAVRQIREHVTRAERNVAFTRARRTSGDPRKGAFTVGGERDGPTVCRPDGQHREPDGQHRGVACTARTAGAASTAPPPPSTSAATAPHPAVSAALSGRRCRWPPPPGTSRPCRRRRAPRTQPRWSSWCRRGYGPGLADVPGTRRPAADGSAPSLCHRLLAESWDPMGALPLLAPLPPRAGRVSPSLSGSGGNESIVARRVGDHPRPPRPALPAASARRSLVGPPAETGVRPGPRPVPLGHLPPGHSGTELPHEPVEDRPVVPPHPVPRPDRKQRPNELPLRIGQFMAT